MAVNAPPGGVCRNRVETAISARSITALCESFGNVVALQPYGATRMIEHFVLEPPASLIGIPMEPSTCFGHE